MHLRMNSPPIRRMIPAALVLAVVFAALDAAEVAAAAPTPSPQGSGLLARGAGYGQPRGSAQVRRIQRQLRSAGEVPGPVDGRFGPLTEFAVRRFQVRERLAVDGVVGPRTETALGRSRALLRRGAGYGDADGAARVRALQRRLHSVGASPGPVDGRFGPLTEAAVREFQSQQRLAADGVVGERTRGALRQRLAQLSGARPESHGRQKQRGNSKAKKPSGQSAPSRPLPKAPAVTKPRSDDGGLSRSGALALVLAGSCALVLLLLTVASARRSRRAPASVHEAPARKDLGRLQESTPATDARGSRAIPVLGYASGEAQPGHHARADLRAQAKTISRECESRGLALIELVHEREPQRGSALERPGLGYALERIAAGDAKGLAVAELSRLTHSAPDLGRVLEWFSGSDVRLIAVAEGLDTDDPAGQLAVRVLIQVAGWERERLVERTRDGMQAARSKGPPDVADYPDLRDRIARMRADGMTLQAIADRLNAEAVPTVRGGARWRPSSVQAAAGYRRPAARKRVAPTGDNRGHNTNPPDP
jgi:peptidoglycan hydrolase-like protein with peptidoglycan-binding domain/DNA invertase Pin-like site-specific DNA recombinase